MINANGLRIGNLLIVNRGDDYSQPEERIIDAIDIGVADNNPERFSPIRLTVEILKICGWEKTPLFWSKKSCGFEIEVCEENYNIIHEYVTLTTIHYVHQLQNLYFALTGKEPEIKTL